MWPASECFGSDMNAGCGRVGDEKAVGHARGIAIASDMNAAAQTMA
jgi:hypothetical protein